MKKISMTVGILALASLIAVPVFAQWGPRGGGWMMGGGGYGYGPCAYGYGGGNGYNQLTPEQQSNLQNLRQQYYDETTTTKQQLWEKRDQLNALMSTSNPDEAKAKELQAQINDLRNTLDQKRLAFQLEAQKIAPNAGVGQGYGYGPGRGMRGGYGGYGPRGGYGPGPCGY